MRHPPDADGDVTGGSDGVMSQSESASDGLCECPENPQVDEFNAALQTLAQAILRRLRPHCHAMPI